MLPEYDSAPVVMRFMARQKRAKKIARRSERTLMYVKFIAEAAVVCLMPLGYVENKHVKAPHSHGQIQGMLPNGLIP